MPLTTVPYRAEATSKLFNDIHSVLTGDGTIIDQPIAFTRNTDPLTFALTIKHDTPDADKYKGLLIQDTNNLTVLEVAALGGGGPDKNLTALYIPGDRVKLAVSNTRNWQSLGDVFFNRTRQNTGETGSFVPVQMAYIAAVQPPLGFGSTPGPTNLLPDEVVCHFYAQASNIASGAAQNHDGSLRAYEAICIQFQGTGKRSMAAATMGMHTAVNCVSYLDNPTVNDDFFGSCGIILLTQDSSGRPGFGTNVAPNCGFMVAGAPTWKYGFAYLDGANNRLFSVDSSGNIRQRGNHNFEVGVPGQRVNADLSSATDATRFQFTTTTPNGTADVGVLPHGTARKGSWTAWGNSDVGNSQFIRMQTDQSINDAAIITGKTGVLGVPHLYMRPGGVETLRFQADGNVMMPDAGIATSATAGFFYLTSSNGAPTGAPATTSCVPLVFDRAAGRMYARYAGAWHWVQFT